MISELRYYLYSIKKNFINSSELRMSFNFSIISMVLNNFSFVFIWYLFSQKVGEINGWGFNEILALQGYVGLIYGICYLFFGGFTTLGESISNGSFDKFLLTPKFILNRISTSYFQTTSIGDVLQGVICLLIFAYITNPSLTQIFLMLLVIILSSIIYISFQLFLSALSFYFPESLNIIDDIDSIYNTASMYPGGAFEGFLRFFFIFIIPSLLIGTIPVEVVKYMKPDMVALLVAMSVFWFLFSYKFFMNGVKNYESSNTYTFGK
jgi:ABC-2 type transport system permease protein